MKRKAQPLIWSLLLLCLALGGGIFYSFSHTKQEVTPKQATSKVSQTLETKENTSQTEKKSNAKKDSIQTSQNSESKTTVEQQTKEEQKTFNQEVLSQNYYVEHVDDKGNLTYIKATEKELQALEAKNNTLSTYQVTYNGQLISVLASPERN